MDYRFWKVLKGLKLVALDQSKLGEIEKIFTLLKGGSCRNLRHVPRDAAMIRISHKSPEI